MEQQLGQNIRPKTQSPKLLSKKWQIVALVLAGILAIGSILFGLYYFWQKSAENTNQIACTMEVRQCDDGSYVSRTGANCEFTECPSVRTK